MWQNRFYSCALDERHLWTALRYVEQNPVRAGLCHHAGEYTWSSAAVHLSEPADRELLDLTFWRQEGGAERWRALLASADEYAEIRRLQQCTFTGRPYGSEEFVCSVEQQLGRRLRVQETRGPQLVRKSAVGP